MHAKLENSSANRFHRLPVGGMLPILYQIEIVPQLLPGFIGKLPYIVTTGADPEQIFRLPMALLLRGGSHRQLYKILYVMYAVS